MSFRFRKTVRLAPGIKLNLSKSGVSWSLGLRGATVNLGSKKPRITIGVPGTGVSFTAPIADPDDSNGSNAVAAIIILVALLGAILLI